VSIAVGFGVERRPIYPLVKVCSFLWLATGTSGHMRRRPLEEDEEEEQEGREEGVCKE
jgi:hypothetical protein